MLAVVVISVVSLVFLVRAYIKWSQKYWERRNVPTTKTISIFGNLENPFRSKHGFNIMIKRNYDEFKKRGLPYGGIYSLTTPMFMPIDTNLIKRILAADFSHFTGHGFGVNAKNDPISAHLFNLEGAEWKNMRTKLTPTFTSGKMKMMFKTLVDCGGPMIDQVGKLCKNKENLNIKEILACYTTDVIGSCAFGLECNSFKDPNAEFRRYGRKIFEPSFRSQMRLFLRFCIPAITEIISFKTHSMDIENFFMNAVRNIMDYRKGQGIKRNDFIQMFLEMEAKAKASGEQPLTLEQVAAQAFVFFLAGFETSSTTMTFCLHELAFNPDIQDKVRDEVRDTLNRNNGELTYDGIMGMKYMDQVINETLRKYPPVAVINRVCSQEYKVPGTDLVIEEGTKIAISTLGLHRDEEYYPNSEKFEPERFSDENKHTRPDFAFLPFGEGPRICIGLRFGLMQAKTGLSMLLNNYRILPAESESYKINFDPQSLVLTKNGNIMLSAEKL